MLFSEDIDKFSIHEVSEPNSTPSEDIIVLLKLFHCKVRLRVEEQEHIQILCIEFIFSFEEVSYDLEILEVAIFVSDFIYVWSLE